MTMESTQHERNEMPQYERHESTQHERNELPQAARGPLTAKLWNIDIAAWSGGAQPVQQLTTSHVLIVPLTGEGTLELGERRRRLYPDTAYLCLPESTFAIAAGAVSGLSVAIVRFGLFRACDCDRDRGSGQLAAAVGDDLLPEGAYPLAPAGRLAQRCRSLHELWCSGDALKRWRAELDFQNWLYEMAMRRGGRCKDDTRAALERATIYIEEHFSEELTIDRLAEIAGLSAKYFVDIFKKTYGVSAHDYLTQIRIDQAKRLMLRGDLLLRDVAHEVGYDDEYYFSRRFKKTVGIAPSAFVKKRKRKIAAYGPTSLLGYLLPLHIVPYAAPLHPKWSRYYLDAVGAEIPVHLDGFRQNYRWADNLDKLASARPELIICPAGLDAREISRLKEIADVFELPEERLGWRRQLLDLAALLDVQAEAEGWIAACERRASEIRERIAWPCSETVLAARLHKSQLFAGCGRGMAEVLHDLLGFLSPYPEAQEPYSFPITPEQLDAAGAGRVLLTVCQESETLASWQRLRQSPQWLSLKVVRDDRVILVASEPWREYSPVAIDRMLEDARRIFSG